MRPVIDWSGNCGNLSAAVGAFALSAGLVEGPADGMATVRIWQANIGKVIVNHVAMRGGEVQELGDFELDGVAFPAAEVKVEFLDPAADEEDGGEAGGGAMFPSGKRIDVLDVPGVGRLEATLINAGNPTVFVDAERLGLTGTELQGDINGDKAAAAEGRGRARAGLPLTMGLVRHARGSDGDAAAHPQARIRSQARALCRVRRQEDRGWFHRPAGAHLLHGRAAPCHDRDWRRGHRGCRRDPRHDRQHAWRRRVDGRVRFGHPSGTLSVGAEAREDAGQWKVAKVMMSRSARRLMEGWVRVPAE
jgi:2-methylaconitate cis-trans-isomerase PrpF